MVRRVVFRLDAFGLSLVLFLCFFASLHDACLHAVQLSVRIHPGTVGDRVVHNLVKIFDIEEMLADCLRLGQRIHNVVETFGECPVVCLVLELVWFPRVDKVPQLLRSLYAGGQDVPTETLNKIVVVTLVEKRFLDPFFACANLWDTFERLEQDLDMGPLPLLASGDRPIQLRFGGQQDLSVLACREVVREERISVYLRVRHEVFRPGEIGDLETKPRSMASILRGNLACAVECCNGVVHSLDLKQSFGAGKVIVRSWNVIPMVRRHDVGGMLCVECGR